MAPRSSPPSVSRSGPARNNARNHPVVEVALTARQQLEPPHEIEQLPRFQQEVSIRRLAARGLRPRECFIDQQTARRESTDQVWKERPMQIVHDDDDVVRGSTEWIVTAFEIAHFGAKRQTVLARSVVQLAYRFGIAIEGKCRESSLGQPERVTPASTRDVERASITRQQAGVLHEP